MRSLCSTEMMAASTLLALCTLPFLVFLTRSAPQSVTLINFGAGPSQMPQEVLHEVQREMVQYYNTSMSLMEISHRAIDYTIVHNRALQLVREIYELPDNYKVLFLQGGGQGCFSSIPMNLINRTRTADYFVHGIWSEMAATEAQKYGVITHPFPHNGTHVPPPATWNLNPNASYVHYVDNETSEGAEFPYIPDTGDVPLISDMASNIFTKRLDITKYGMIYAPTQKLLGPAGAVLIIIREDLLNYAVPSTPLVMQYKANYEWNSALNTPPTFTIYVVGKMLQWIKNNGGLAAMEANALTRSQMLYDIIDGSNGFYSNQVDRAFRSRMNVVFRIGGPNGNATLETAFLEGAAERNMVQLRGHSLVGGIRVSLYNAISIQDTSRLANFMNDFLSQHQS